MKRREFLQSSSALTGGAVLGAMLGAGLAPWPVAAADDQPVNGGTLIWGHSETTQNLDIHQTGTASTIRVLQNVHDSIVTVDKNFTVIPSLAKSFEQSADGLTYTFHLRPGVKFHDGKTDDLGGRQIFVRPLPRQGDGRGQFRGVQRRRSDRDAGRSHRRHQDERVNAPFLQPARRERRRRDHARRAPATSQGKTPIGAGPFKFVRREFGHEVELVRFDDYWDGPAYLDKVIAREVTEPTVRLTGLRTGEMHMINDIPADRMKEVKERPEASRSSPGSRSTGTSSTSTTTSSRSRTSACGMAIDLLIDKEALLQGALWGEGRMTASPSFPTSASYNADAQEPSAGHRKGQAAARRGGLRAGQARPRVQGDHELSLPRRVGADHARMVQGSRHQHEDRAADLGRLAEPGLGQQGLPDLDDELLHPVGAGFPLLQPLAFDRRVQLPPHQGSGPRRSCLQKARRDHRSGGAGRHLQDRCSSASTTRTTT